MSRTVSGSNSDWVSRMSSAATRPQSVGPKAYPEMHVSKPCARFQAMYLRVRRPFFRLLCPLVNFRFLLRSAENRAVAQKKRCSRRPMGTCQKAWVKSKTKAPTSPERRAIKYRR